MKPFRELEVRHLNPAIVRHEMDTYGYALIRNLLPATMLNNLLQQIMMILSDAGWLARDRECIGRKVNPGVAYDTSTHEYKAVYDRVFALPIVHSLPHDLVFCAVTKALAGDQLLLHPKPEIRLIFPNFAAAVIHAHQDHTAVRGDTETYTVWLPLHDCPPDQGPLQVLEGSHRFGLQSFDSQTGYTADHLLRGGHWAVGEIRAGDLLLFHSLTVHRAAPNQSNLLRISMDFRFQSSLRPVHPASLVFAGSGGRTWAKVYAGWPSDELKFYWTNLPLQLRPSIPELVDLAQSSPSLEERQRYGRILSQITAETIFHAPIPPSTQAEIFPG